MEYKNFSISSKKEQFYEKSKTEKEGYEEVIYGEGKKTYHKYQKTVEGTPSYFTVKEVPYMDKTLRFLELSVVKDDVTSTISVPLKSSYGYTDESKAMVSALNGYKLGEPVSISVKKNSYVTKSGKERDSLVMYINYDNIKNESGRNESTGYIHFNDIPGPETKEVAGETVYIWDNQTNFYYEKINEIQDRFKNNTSNETEKKEEPISNQTTEIDQDDLPF